MGVTKGSVCPVDDNSIFIIRKHGNGRAASIPSTKSGFSRQASIKSSMSKASRLTLDEDLEALKAANLVFVRQVQQEADKLTNVPNKYIIVSTSGESMFFAVETSDAVTRLTFEVDQPFKFTVVNTNGEEVFDIDGHPGVNGIGAYVSVKRDNVILGNVAQINKVSRCLKVPPSYLIECPAGRTLQKIRRQDNWKTTLFGCFTSDDFNVYSPDGTICKAKISRQRNAISLEEYSQADTYALSFHTTDMDGKVKALLLAAVLMLDFQFFESRHKNNRKSFVIRVIICIVFIGLLIGGIVLVAHNAVDFQKERESRFPGKIST